MKCAALSTGTDYHLLDHIAPLADLYQMPLIVTEEQTFELAKRYYPQVTLRYMPDFEFRLGEIAREFDTLYKCTFWEPRLKAIFRTLYNKEMKLIFCPHGQSDKGFRAPLLTHYATQDAVLLYGPLLLSMLNTLKISVSNYTFIGNYRLHFYQKYRPFYDALLHFPKNKKTLLYAPTWQDADNSTSFFNYTPKLISELPPHWNLLIKPHPLLEQCDPARFHTMAAQINTKPNAFLIDQFPPVYPILAQADAYLGDASSVGYDFLFFNRPLYFFPTEYPGKLHSCGTILNPNKCLFDQLENPPPVQGKQHELYSQAFGSN